LIDLHLHTTASDGTLSPSELVGRARAAGLGTIAITDHDTTAGTRAARDAARTAGLELVPGIEISAVADGRDVHLLGYFIDVESPALVAFLDAQRVERLRRITAMGDRLRSLGCAIDVAPILDASRRGRSVGRPQIADALVRAGYVAGRDEAFARFLEYGAPGFVPRCGAGPIEVVDVVHAAGGVVSMAHPGLTKRDDLIPSLAAHGLDAIEVRHSDHDAATEARYRAMAAELGVVATGGSDYHGDVGARAGKLGAVTMAPDDFAALGRVVKRRRAMPAGDIA
jgi:predicted metal-dependent phosphoesterase TrpH